MLTKATFSMISGAPVNVLDFGAVGDGVTDDTAAVQAAIDFAAAVILPGEIKTVFFPSGKYLLSNIDLTGSATTRRGLSVVCDNSVFFTAPDTSTDIFNISQMYRMTWEGGEFQKCRYAFACETGTFAYCRFTNLRFRPQNPNDIVSCFYAVSAVGNTFTNCQFGWDGPLGGITTAVDFTASTAGEVNINRFIACDFIQFDQYGYRQRTSVYRKAANSFFGCWFESSDGVAVDAGNETQCLTFDTCYFEDVGDATTYPVMLQNAGNVKFDNCFWTANKVVPGFADVNAGSLRVDSMEARTGTAPTTFAFRNIAELQQVLNVKLIADSGSPDYKTLLFSADNDTTENLINWNIPRNSGTISGDEYQTSHVSYSREYSDGFLRHSCAPVQMVDINVWYDVATITVPGSGTTTFRAVVESGTLLQGVGAAGRKHEMWLTRSGGAVTAATISNVTTGSAAVELQVVDGGTGGSTAKVQVRRTAGTNSAARPLVQIYQADSDIASRRVSIS